MAYIENFIGYTRVDPNTRITRTTRRVTWASLNEDEEAYVYDDKGVDYFAGGFTHYATVYIDSFTGTPLWQCVPWALTNDIDSIRDIYNNSGDAEYLRFGVTGGANRAYISEVDGGDNRESPTYYTFALDTLYYLKITRNESVGTYGTLYCYIYSDPARTTLLSTLTLTLATSKKDFRYIYAINNSDRDQGAINSSGYVSNLQLISVSLQVTTQPVTAVTTTTATGNGIMVDLGLATVTAHGHCWELYDETSVPTTSDSSVDNGEGSLGAYTSSLTNLIAGQRYSARAFATSTEGTVYGANVTFTAGYTSTQLIRGNLAVVQGRLQYIGADGIERYSQGTPV